MSSNEEMFQKELMSAFLTEAREQVQSLALWLSKLESSELDAKQRMTLIESIFRETHNLKGSARATGSLGIEAVCQGLEGLFSMIKQGKLTLSSHLIDALHTGIDALSGALAADVIEEGSKSASTLSEVASGLENLLIALTSSPQDDQFLETPPAKKEPAAAPPTSYSDVLASAGSASKRKGTSTSDTIRITGAALDQLLLQVEEMLSFKVRIKQHSQHVQEIMAMTEAMANEWSQIYPHIGQAHMLVDRASHPNNDLQVGAMLSRLIEYVDNNRNQMRAIDDQLNIVSTLLSNDDRYASTTVDALVADTKKLLMLPCSTLLDTFPKLVRDLSKELGKEVDVSIEGVDITLDKRILAQIKDPLMHLIRNSIDHGVEKPEDRLQHGKARRASLKLAVKQLDGGLNEITISDDGAGINIAKVKEMAVKGNYLTAEAAAKLSRQEITSLIFHSSLSTSPIITELSGRGLGLAIVKDNITQLGGRLEVQSEEGLGTTFTLLLPSTIASFRGVWITCRGQSFILPTSSVVRVVRLQKDDIKQVENADTIAWAGTMIPLIPLADVLEIADTNNDKQDPGANFIIAAILTSSDQYLAFQVDEIVREQEVLVKPLSSPLQSVRNIAGATVLSSGQVIPVLNVSDLIKSARLLPAATSRPSKKVFADKVVSKRILVVDDTITTRMLLKNILESAGYQVVATNDGLEAFSTLQEEEFDLVVTDIEMPKMNGFELTTSIRRDPKLAHTPVVLVTSLSSPEDREKGVQAGADAFFIKSRFDHSSLLEIIHRLVFD
jgi:two-component system, chemotaxis family, sensor kinase CheA